MRSKAIADCGWRIADGALASLAAVLIVGLAAVAWADSHAERAQKLAKLTADEKEELLRKKERFDKLEPEEQERLRKLHELLESRPDAQQLGTVMENYANWLKGLLPAQRSEVLSLPVDQRIGRIKEIVKIQESQRFRDFAELLLPPEDQEKIYQWLDKFVAEHEKEILDAIQSDRDRWRIRSISDDKARRKVLMIRIGFRHPESKIPFPSQDDIDEMAKGLSETTRKELAKPPTEQERSNRTRGLVLAAIGSIWYPHPSEEELRKYYAALPSESRAALENLDDSQLQKELRRMYRKEKYTERGPYPSGPPRGGGRGPGGGPPPPPDSNRQPPGFANPAPKGK
jgi:hypothetical protein